MLGAALQATGSQPNILVPIKGDYFKIDIIRCAKIMGLAFTMPDKMPMNSLAAARAFTRLMAVTRVLLSNLPRRFIRLIGVLDGICLK